MTPHALVAALLESDEDIDWTPDPEDPDASLKEPDTWFSIAQKHGFKLGDQNYQYMAFREFPDWMFKHHPIRMNISPANPPMDDLYTEAVAMSIGRGHDRFLVPTRYLDAFLSKLFAAIPELERSSYLEYRSKGHDAPSLHMRIKTEAKAILASLGLPWSAARR